MSPTPFLTNKPLLLKGNPFDCQKENEWCGQFSLRHGAEPPSKEAREIERALPRQSSCCGGIQKNGELNIYSLLQVGWLFASVKFKFTQPWINWSMVEWVWILHMVLVHQRAIHCSMETSQQPPGSKLEGWSRGGGSPVPRRWHSFKITYPLYIQ